MNFNLQNTIRNHAPFKSEEFIDIRAMKKQGLYNTTYLLTTSKDKYVVKKYDISYNNVSKKQEQNIQLLAYKKGIATKPLLLDTKNTITISRYQQGYKKKHLDRSNLCKLAKTLHTLHGLRFHGKIFDAYRYFRKNTKHKPHSSRLSFSRLQKLKSDLVLCHNDLNPDNVLFSRNINLIDWEYASINDRYFDLASVAVEFNLNTREEQLFLRAYFKKKKTDNKKLQIYKTIYRDVCKIWFDIISEKKDKRCQEQF